MSIVLLFPSKYKLKTNMCSPCTDKTILIYSLCILEAGLPVEGRKIWRMWRIWRINPSLLDQKWRIVKNYPSLSFTFLHFEGRKVKDFADAGSPGPDLRLQMLLLYRYLLDYGYWLHWCMLPEDEDYPEIVWVQN